MKQDQNTPQIMHTLTTKHILMIALGGAIGTGLFFGSIEPIKSAGASIILAYLIGGVIMYIVVRSLGEMVVYEPNVGSFSYYAYKYIGKYAGFIAGWNYWFNYIIVCMLELTATTIFLDYWFPNNPHWLVAIIVLAIFALVNLISVKFFGEFEFWFAGIKIFAIIAFIFVGMYLIFKGSATTATNNGIGLQNLLHTGTFFAGGIKGFLISFIVVIFSFGGTELIGITAGESKNPSKVVPIAINGIVFRILLFYIATLTIIMCLYPYNKLSNDISPFVDVFQKIGMQNSATVMNLVAITVALSAFNTGVYGTTRMLYNLGQQNNAPKAFNKLNKNGVPYVALGFSLICILFTVLINYLYPKQTFGILLSIATISAILNWIIILITQIKFRYSITKKSGTYHGYKIPWFPFLPILAIIFFVIVIGIMLYSEDKRLAIYISPVWILILSIGYVLNNFRLRKQ